MEYNRAFDDKQNKLYLTIGDFMSFNNNMTHALSSAGVAINTCLFGINLFREEITWAILALVCASLCWIGVFKNEKGE